jgi:CheY-like chemotaxis protein
VEDEPVWQTLLRNWCAEAGCAVVQEWDATAALHRLPTLSPPPVLALVDLRLHPTGGTAPHQVYDGLPLLTALSSRGIYTLVVSSHIPEIPEILLERPGVLDLITKGYVPPDAFVAKVRQAVAYATAARHAEGQLPEQQARLCDLPLSSRLPS